VDEGDLVVLWITGTDSPGIYEIGYINGPIESGVIDTEHLVDEDKRGKTVPVAPFRTALLTEHVPRSDLKADPVLASCEQFRIPVISNPTYLTPQEVQALLAYLRPKDLKAAGWTAARLRKAGVR
jgi:hypothetical protein